MVTKDELVKHFIGTRENLTEEALKDINEVIDIFWDCVYTQQDNKAAMVEGIAAIVAVVDSWAWMDSKETNKWASDFLEGALKILKPIAEEALSTSIKFGLEAIKKGLI